MGRSRRHNPTIPAHIDQTRLPKGIYWQRGRWTVFEPHPEGGPPRKVTVAWANARLSELHEVMELRAGGEVRGTLGYLVDRYFESLQFQNLAKGSRDDYRTHAALARDYLLADGSRLGSMQVDRMTVPFLQRLVDTLAQGREARGLQPALKARPSTANHVLRTLRTVFSWGVQRGHCRSNPGKGVKQAKERGQHQMPDHSTHEAMLAFARERCARPLRTKGSLVPYVAPVLALAFNLRLRGIELTDLTDAHALKEGVLCQRHKGSLTNITAWNDDLRQAWAELVAYRQLRWTAHAWPVPAKAEERFLLVDTAGQRLTRSALSQAIGKLKTLAKEAGVLLPEQRFSLHGLKHRGVTDTPGNRADKKQASGHKTDAMLDLYDHEVPVVQPPRSRGKS